MNTIPRRSTPAPIIDLHTRQPMQETPKPSRGGHQERLPRFTLVVPKYHQYQGKLKSGHKRTWCKFERIAPQEMIADGLGTEARCVFYELVLMSSEGALTDTTAGKLAKLLGMNYRTVTRCLWDLIARRMVDTDGPFDQEGSNLCAGMDWQQAKQERFKSKSSQVQVESKSGSSQVQVETLERSADDAVSGDPDSHIKSVSHIETVGSEPAADAAADASADDLAALAAKAEAEAKAAEDAAKQAEKLHLARQWLTAALGGDLAARQWDDLTERSLSAKTDNPDAWIVRQVSGLRTKAKSAPSDLLADAVTKALNVSAPLSYAHSVIDNRLKEAAARGDQPATARPQRGGKPLGHGMGRNGLTQPGSIWDIDL